MEDIFVVFSSTKNGHQIWFELATTNPDVAMDKVIEIARSQDEQDKVWVVRAKLGRAILN